MKRVRIFQAILVAIPVLFFVFLELALRFFDYGRVTPLFIENPAAPHYLLPKPDVIKRYFPEGAATPSVTIETNFFLKEKPKDGIRLVVQGGSTAAGFPFGYGASIAGMLDYRLKQSFPDRSVEVINTALSAVNSYTVLDFVDEIIEQQPDAVLIYAGHNEYLGILGVGSAYTAANSQAATLLYLKVKELRLFQLMQNLYWAFTHTNNETIQNNQTSRTFMSKVAKHKNIPLDSPLYLNGLSQFETNISMVIGKYQAAGIPVFISSIASNLADQKPFSSTKLPNSVNFNATTDKLLTQAAQYQSADLYYQAGQQLLNEGKFTEARNALVLARDLDLLRFRAPSAINTIINKLSQQETVFFVDSEKALTNYAAHNIIGQSLMLEHLHPTITGYFIIADTFYKAINNASVIGKFPRYISYEQAQNDLPVFDAEVFWGKAKIAGLMADYPFTNTPQKVKLPPIVNWQDKLGLAAYKKQVNWLTIANENIARSKENNAALYLKSVKLLADAMPFDATYNYRAGVALIEHKAFAQAYRYLKRAIAAAPKNINSQLALSHAYLQEGELQKAIVWLESVLKISPNNATANEVLPQVKAYLQKNKPNS